MKKSHAKLFVGAAMAAALFLSSFQPASAGTILKLSLGDDPPNDIEYSGGLGGILSTIDDGDGTSPGDQNTAVEFLGFLSSMTNIPTADASYTISGVSAAGPVIPIGTVVVQPLTGGSFQLWDDDDTTLLLDVVLGSSAIVGTLGHPSGAVFSTAFGTPTGNGTLDSLIVPNTVSMSIDMADINGSAGLSVSPFIVFSLLNAFEAHASKNIAAEGVPEPSAALLLALGALVAPAVLRRGA